MSLDKSKKIITKTINNEMLKGLYKDLKKVKNEKMKIFFNYHLKYSTFKEGLEMIINNII